MSFKDLLRRVAAAFSKTPERAAAGSAENPSAKTADSPAKKPAAKTAAPAGAAKTDPARAPRRSQPQTGGGASAATTRRRDAAANSALADSAAASPSAVDDSIPLRTHQKSAPYSPQRSAQHRRAKEELQAFVEAHKTWDPATFEVPPEEGKARFQDFELRSEIIHAVADAGFKYCTPIQKETLSSTMAGSNVAGKAQTGTGKTAAFLIAIIQRMLEEPTLRPARPGHPAALILAPTRELVVQIIKDADVLGKYAGLRSLAVYGGTDYAAQQSIAESQPLDLIAATPGRLLDFGRSGILNLSNVRILVIDEADRMLDMGFIPDVRKIIYKLPPQDKRQTLLFSATLDEAVMRLASAWMPAPVKIEVEPEHAVLDTIRQVVYPIAAREKFTVLYNILKLREGKRFLIFRNRKRDCDQLCRELASYGIETEQLSGDVEQKKRMRVLEDFRSGAKRIVIATDVAGRGIHIDDINYVVNYDFPYQADDYIHRIGRTGRAGASGTAISFACEDESFIIPDIEKLLGEELRCPQPDAPLLAPLPPRVNELVAAPRRSASPHGEHRDGHRSSGGFRRGGSRPGGGLRRR